MYCALKTSLDQSVVAQGPPKFCKKFQRFTYYKVLHLSCLCVAMCHRSYFDLLIYHINLSSLFTASMKPTCYICDSCIKLIRLNFGNDGQQTTAMLLFAYCAELAEGKQKPLRESTSLLLTNPFHGWRETHLHLARAPLKNRRIIVLVDITET